MSDDRDVTDLCIGCSTPQLRVCGETLGLSILGFWSRALGLFSADHHNDQDQAAIQTAMAPNHFVISGAGAGEAWQIPHWSSDCIVALVVGEQWDEIAKERHSL